jgi:regulator of sirC expression with transglutaminase-like and TPR domain
MYDTSLRVIGDQRALAEPDLQGLYTFALAEAHRRRGKEGDAEQAGMLYAEAVGQPGAPPAAHREHGLALRASGDAEGAARSLSSYLTLAPDAEDAAFVRQYLNELEGRP